MLAVLLFQLAGSLAEATLPTTFDLADLERPAEIVVNAPVTHHRSRYLRPQIEPPARRQPPVSVRMRGRKLRLRMAY